MKRCTRCRSRKREEAGTCPACVHIDAAALDAFAQATLASRGISHLVGISGIFVTAGIGVIALFLAALSWTAFAIGAASTMFVLALSLFCLERGKLYSRFGQLKRAKAAAIDEVNS